MPTFALIIWPIVSIAIFAGLGPQRGLIWSVVIGYLFLPDGYQLNPPGLPSYSKETAIAIGALFGTLITAGRLSAERPVADRTVVWMFGGLLALILIGPFLTTMVNRAPVFFGPTVRQGMTLWDVQTHDKLDKDRFRRDLGGESEAYQEVARRLGLLEEDGGNGGPGEVFDMSAHRSRLRGTPSKPKA